MTPSWDDLSHCKKWQENNNQLLLFQQNCIIANLAVVYCFNRVDNVKVVDLASLVYINIVPFIHQMLLWN